MKSGEVYPSKYLRAEELTEDLAVTIKTVRMEKMETKDRGEQNKPVMYFNEIDKGLVLNKTNWSIIAKQHGDESDDWTGKQIVLFAMDVEAFGEMVLAIRVRTPRKQSPVVPGVKKGSEIEANGELITKYWTTAKALGLDRTKGLELLRAHNNDFEAALKHLESETDTPF